MQVYCLVNIINQVDRMNMTKVHGRWCGSQYFIWLRSFSNDSVIEVLYSMHAVLRTANYATQIMRQFFK